MTRKHSANVPEAWHDVHHSGWNPNFFQHFAKKQSCKGCLFCRFENHRVTCRECRSDFPCRHEEREGAWDDLAAHADWLPARIGGELRFMCSKCHGGIISFSLVYV